MSVLGIVAMILVALLVVRIGVAWYRDEQEQIAMLEVLCDRLNREPAYLETVNERLKRESRRGH